MTCHIVLPFRVVAGRWSHHASLMQAKGGLKMQKIRSLNHAWKGFSKTWNQWNSQIFEGLPKLPLDLTRGAYSTAYEPPVAMANMLIHIGLKPKAIKLNPSWKMNVSKSDFFPFLRMILNIFKSNLFISILDSHLTEGPTKSRFSVCMSIHLSVPLLVWLFSQECVIFFLSFCLMVDN